MASIENIEEKELSKLERHGYSIVKGKTTSEKLRMTGPATLVYYKNKRLLVQGSKEKINEAMRLIEFLGITCAKRGEFGTVVGTDESLKGDTFGGLVVAGFLADEEIRCELKTLGVKDSKQLFNPDIVRIATVLMERFPKNFHAECITPREYNKASTKLNVTDMLNHMHAKCHDKLSKKAIHIVDLYPGCTIGDIKETKAESKYLEVAAASIIARYHALKQIRDLESKAGFFIPLGSTHVESALLEIKKKELNYLDYVKSNFRNVMKLF